MHSKPKFSSPNQTVSSTCFLDLLRCCILRKKASVGSQEAKCSCENIAKYDGTGGSTNTEPIHSRTERNSTIDNAETWSEQFKPLTYNSNNNSIEEDLQVGNINETPGNINETPAMLVRSLSENEGRLQSESRVHYGRRGSCTRWSFNNLPALVVKEQSINDMILNET